jgi:hypothetical protein
LPPTNIQEMLARDHLQANRAPGRVEAGCVSGRG